MTRKAPAIAAIIITEKRIERKNIHYLWLLIANVRNTTDRDKASSIISFCAQGLDESCFKQFE